MPEGRLLRLLGVGFGVAVTVGGTVGVGILRTPGIVAAQLLDPGRILAVWILGGLYALAATLCVIELGTAMPSAGGWYVYSRRAFGDAVVSAAFLVANIAGDPRSSALAFGLLAASYPAYRLLARARDRRAAAIIR